MPAPAGLVHGMGKELAEPDWSPLTSAEVHTVLAAYPWPGGDELITWRSPRPMSAAGLVRRGGADLFVKRHHVRGRTSAQLAVEHEFIGHLRSRCLPAPDVLPAIRRAAPLLAGLPRQWGHGDWHPSNLTWTSAGPDAVVAGVFDFGLANRTFAVHDLATALERATVSWLDLADPDLANPELTGLGRAAPDGFPPHGPGPGRAEADLDAIDAFLDGYESVRPLTRAEAAALPEVVAVVHVDYALAEVEYFADVVSSPANADLAYDDYLLGHAAWFASPDGAP